VHCDGDHEKHDFGGLLWKRSNSPKPVKPMPRSACILEVPVSLSLYSSFVGFWFFFSSSLSIITYFFYSSKLDFGWKKMQRW